MIKTWKIAGITLSLCFLVSCDNDLKDIQNMHAKTLFPSGIAENFDVKYTDSAQIRAVLVAPKMMDYSNAKYPFNHFPKGVHLTVYDENKNQNFVVADKATAYNKTGIIELKGNVKITTHDKKVMETQQLFYDQKQRWFFTEAYFKITDPNKSIFEGIGIDFDNKFKIMNAQQNRAILNDNDNTSTP